MPNWWVKIGLESGTSDPRGPWWGWLLILAILALLAVLVAE